MRCGSGTRPTARTGTSASKATPVSPRGRTCRGLTRHVRESPRPGTASSCKRSEEHTSELQSQSNLVCRLLLEKKKNTHITYNSVMISAANPTLYTPQVSLRHPTTCV